MSDVEILERPETEEIEAEERPPIRANDESSPERALEPEVPADAESDSQSQVVSSTDAATQETSDDSNSDIDDTSKDSAEAIATEKEAVEEESMSDIKVQGELVLKLPDDLFIPPDALQIFLEAFEGPLDLLLYLIKKQNIDILDIPIVDITRQYMEYIDLMKDLQLELAAEYLVMAATLAEIKSRFLLPRQVEEEEDEGEDPRAELIRRLQEYERFKKAAEDINTMVRLERDLFVALAEPPEFEIERPDPQVSLDEVFKAFRDVMSRAKLNASHQVERETLSIRERMTLVLEKVKSEEFTEFSELFTVEEGRMGVVVTLIAILELVRQASLEFVQAEHFAPIYVKARS